MKLFNSISSKRILINAGLLILGLFLGWLIFGGSDSVDDSIDHSMTESHDEAVWTCSMHPQIRQDKSGNCPICGMELIPLESDNEGESAEEFSVKLSNTAMKIAEVEVTRIEKKAPYKEIYLPGKVLADERRISELTSRFPGRIEKLMVNFTGQKVKKGQILGKIYSPDLATAQRELFEAIKLKETNPSYYRATRNKLKLWDLTDEQIDEIERSGDVDFFFDILSPISGTVTKRHVAIGDYVKEGSELFEVIDLKHVWVMFDAYESDIPWIKIGDNIRFNIKSIPNQEFESKVTFINPVLDPMSRVVGVRAELDNPGERLKPEMLAGGILRTMLPGSKDKLVIPKSAILWTGKKAVTYVMTNDHNNMFQYREIELGAEAGDYYIIEGGLMEGEIVASNGVFKIDAAAQLQGKKSMMNPEGVKVSMGHNHGADDEESNKSMGGPVNDHQDHQALNPRSVDSNFKKQLTKVYEAYLEMFEAFVLTDGIGARKNAQLVKTELKKVDMGLLKGDMHDHWMSDLKTMNLSLEEIISKEDISDQRLALGVFNETLYGSIKMFGTTEETIFYQYCPMANNNMGAYWLSSEKEIRNPYFGDKMLKCGSIKETL